MAGKRLAGTMPGSDNRFRQLRVERADLQGFACLTEIRGVARPRCARDGADTVCFLDEGYLWLQVYPDGAQYAMTAVFDAQRRPVEWYFDIARSVGTQDGVPYEDDLYLDLVITPAGRGIVLDADELEEAVAAGLVTDAERAQAYRTLAFLRDVYERDPAHLRALTRALLALFGETGEML